MIRIKNLQFKKGGGLIPAIVQDDESGEILMLGYMNRLAVELTLRTGLATFWSRKRKELWVKGETSGNYLDVVEVWTDCDQDTLLIKVDPRGPACHTDERSCFLERGHPRVIRN